MKTFEYDINELVSELLLEKFGEEWYLELAKEKSPHSYASKKHGNQKWSARLAEKLLDKKDEYEFIGIFCEGDTAMSEAKNVAPVKQLYTAIVACGRRVDGSYVNRGGLVFPIVLVK